MLVSHVPTCCSAVQVVVELPVDATNQDAGAKNRHTQMIRALHMLTLPSAWNSNSKNSCPNLPLWPT